MLVPLETLPGWPAAPEPSALQLLLLLVGAPLLIGLVVAGMSWVGSTRELKRYGPVVNPTTSFAGAPGVESAADAVPAGIESGPVTENLGTGGTSARW